MEFIYFFCLSDLLSCNNRSTEPTFENVLQTEEHHLWKLSPSAFEVRVHETDSIWVLPVMCNLHFTREDGKMFCLIWHSFFPPTRLQECNKSQPMYYCKFIAENFAYNYHAMHAIVSLYYRTLQLYMIYHQFTTELTLIISF